MLGLSRARSGDLMRVRRAGTPMEWRDSKMSDLTEFREINLYSGTNLNNLWLAGSGERTVSRSRQAIPRSCVSSFRFAQPKGIGETNRCSMGTISRKVVLTDGDTQESGAQDSS